jgi:4'-phosphopantetheinyl transferase
MTTWTESPEPLTLTQGEVHLWLHPLSLDDSALEVHRLGLSAAELERASRFSVPVDCRRYVESRGTLRSLLGRYLGEAPESIAFGEGAYGKPELKEHREVRFNLSHCGEVALFAFARDIEVGVDVERWRDGIDVDSIAVQVCSPPEAERLRSLNGEARVWELLRCWTQKEAYLKAIGAGLSLVPRSFSLSDDLYGWSVRSFRCPGDYLGALAVRDASRRVCCYQA